MEFNDFIKLVAQKRKIIFGIIALFIIIGVGVIAIQRFKYSSKSQLLVVQEYDRTIDAYTASKSNEYLSSVLASVVTSNSFFTKVTEAGFDINSGYFGVTPKDQMKEWNKTVTTKTINDSGIIAVTVYHPNRAQAEKIDRSINYVLMTQNTAYHGSGDAVKVRLIDQPITSTFPVKPNIPLIIGLAIALGFISGLIYVYVLPQVSVQAPHFYGQHAPYQSNKLPQEPHLPVEEGGYWDEEVISPEEIAQHGSMKNILK